MQTAPPLEWWDGGVELGGEDLVRSTEWRRVREFAVSQRDHPAALVIAAEPGAGKSTLWRAGTAAAEEAGGRVLCSDPSAAEAHLAFAGLSDLLTDALVEVGAGIPAPQREALEVALLLRPAGADPPTARAVGMAVLAALQGLAATGPVLVAIDDVQWLDEASLDAVSFAVRRLGNCPVGVLLAARTEAVDPLAVAAPAPSRRWRDLMAGVPSETIDLAPLDEDQVRRVLPTAVSAKARLITEQSRGNPFWAKEIATSLASVDTPIPASARTLTDRLARSLTPGAAETLAVVGAAGRISVPDALAVLHHLGKPATALDEAVLAGVVTEAGGWLASAHPLIGAAAVEALPPGHRQRIHQRLAEATASPETYAHFTALAAASTPDETVAAALDAAADSAHARAGNAEAAQFAIRAVKFTPGEDADENVRRRIRAAELLYVAGDVHQSLEQAEAVDLAELATPDLEHLLPLLLDVIDLVRGAPAATALLITLTGKTGPDPRRRALVLALASDFAYGIRGRRREAAIEAIRSAEAAGPAADGSLHRALLNLVIAEVHASEGLDNELLDRAERLETHMDLDRLHDSADLCRGLWSRYVEDLDTSRAALRRCIERVHDAGDDFTLMGFLSYLAATEELAGDYSAARRALAAGDAVAAWYDWPLLPFRTEPRCDLLIANGDLEAALALAARGLPNAPSRPGFLGGLVRGRVSAWRADTGAAIRWFERAADCAEDCEFADPGVRQGLDTALAEAYVADGRTADARQIAGWLRGIGDRLHRSALIGNAYRIEAEAAALDGDLDAAADLSSQAVAAHETTPLRLELARSLLTLGQVERRRRARQRSRVALTRARNLARDTGHQPLLTLVEQELTRVAAVRSGTELTATEQRVTELIAAGASNRDAAAALFVSVRTIESHVASIYRKLGIRSRAELGGRFP